MIDLLRRFLGTTPRT